MIKIYFPCFGILLLSLFFSLDAHTQVPDAPLVGGRVPCADGAAAVFDCHQVDLLSFLPIGDIGGATIQVDTVLHRVRLNDIWGWTDPLTGKEYALVGRSDGTAFIDISDPVNPRFLGLLPSHGLTHGKDGHTATTSGDITTQGILHDDGGAVSTWRDIKVYQDHALVVADNAGAHGMQVFDLAQLRSITDPPVIFSETVHYPKFGSAHNIVVNEETGFAYVVGANGEGTTCGGGLHMVDIRNPLEPVFSGCFSDPSTGLRGTGYTHDAQCVVYKGPDQRYQGREICIGSNETDISIADVTDKSNPIALSSADYPNVGYIHQGWLTEDHRYFFQDDELDEFEFGIPTRTLIWDLVDLENPVLLGEFRGMTTASDHNQYVLGNLVFQANYKAGLRILDISDVVHPVEVAFFDTYPADNEPGFDGAWSTYPFFSSGVVLVSSIREGFFVLKPREHITTPIEADDLPISSVHAVLYPNPLHTQANLILNLNRSQQVSINVFDTMGRFRARLFEGMLAQGEHRFSFDASQLPNGIYLIRIAGKYFAVNRMATVVN